jgi:hypothetical protein
MHPERVYRTKSGTFPESELAVIVWKNPNSLSRPNSRLLATMMDPSSPNPMAFPIEMLRKTVEFASCAVSTTGTLQLDILASSPGGPVIVPIPLARSSLGWTEFYVPTRYEEP